MENQFVFKSESLINLSSPAEGFRVASQLMVFRSGTTILAAVQAALWL